MSTHDLPPLSPEEEAVMHERIEAALAPYLAITPKHLLDVMRREAEEKMRTHPATRRLLAAAARRPLPDASATVARDSVPEVQPGERTGGKEGA
jgi:hypothetical protein